VHEWRSLFVQATPASRDAAQLGRHFRLVDPDIDTRLFTVDELMGLSPAHCTPSTESTPCSGGSAAASGGRRPHVASERAARPSNANHCGDEMADGATAQAPRLGDASRGSSPPTRSRPSAQTGGNDMVDVAGVMERVPDGLHVANPAVRAVRGRHAPPPRPAPESTEAPSAQPFFVRRPAEAYARLEVAESTLTARLRHEASHDDGQLGNAAGVTRAFAITNVAGRALGQVDGDRTVEVRIYLPPYDAACSAVELTVPSTMLVADLRDEAVRKYAGRAGVSKGVEYELRLYDDDEEEPDYDCAAFDTTLQVGLVNEREMALCAVGERSPSSWPSVPSSSPQCEGLRSGASTRGDKLPGVRIAVDEVPCTCNKSGLSPVVEDASPRAMGPAGIGGPASDDAEGLADARRHICVRAEGAPGDKTAEPLVDIVSDAGRPAPNDDSGSGALEADARPPCMISEPEVRAPCPVVLSHRRTRSSPLQGTNTAPLVTVGGFEAIAENVPGRLRRSESQGQFFASLCISSGTSIVERVGAGERAGVAPTGLGSTNTSQTRRLELLVVDGFGQLEADAVSASVNGLGVTSAVSEAIASSGGVVGGSSLGGDDVAAAASGGTPAATEGERVALQVRGDATLYEVLEQLAQERGRPCEPVSLALERRVDGLWQRLDLGMQVQHLPADPSALRMVRKDTPMMAQPPRASGNSATCRLKNLAMLPAASQWQQDAAIRQPPPSAFFFNEYTASIVTEYVVTVAARGSRARPAECELIVDRDRLYHRVPRGAPQLERADHKRTSFMSPLLRKLGRHLHLAEPSSAEASIFTERRVSSVRSIACDESHQRAFLVTYGVQGGSGSNSKESLVELVYEAQTPTECAEIVARLKFLRFHLAK